MFRNRESHFSATDNRINIGRSRFDRNSWWKGTMNTGDLVPFYIDEVLPGDTFDMKTSVLCRMSTPIFPVMDNAYLDTYFFFIPCRLVWDHWKQFMGENDINAWVSDVEYAVPQLDASIGGFRWDYERNARSAKSEFSLADYFGLPVVGEDTSGGGDLALSVNALPFRAYQLVWNEWFRDQNLMDPVLIPKGDSDEFSDVDLMREMLTVRRVCKFHDYFTSCLPAPQKGNPVLIPGFDGSTPVVTRQSVHLGSGSALRFANTFSGSRDIGGNLSLYAGFAQSSGSQSELVDSRVEPVNLWVGSSSGVTIDALRTAFQIQKLLWRDGNGGSRYTEIIRSHFGVVSPDARLQRPEYLGGKRIPITVNQVVQQSSTDDVSPQGNTAAFSKTVDSFNGFTKSFTEHGYIIGVCCIRTDHTYQDGVNRMWSRYDRYDFYFPELAFIGEQAVLNKEVYCKRNEAGWNNGVFGYQEAWAEYRYRPSSITGAFRSRYPESLDVWHYGDDFGSNVYLSAGFVEETPVNVNRTLAVPVAEYRCDQWLLDFYFDLKTTRPMPVYSVPGLVDHF